MKYPIVSTILARIMEKQLEFLEEPLKPCSIFLLAPSPALRLFSHHLLALLYFTGGMKRLKYLLLFFATFLFDNSGTPIPILTATALISVGKLKIFPSFFTIYMGLLSWDTVTFFAGKKLKSVPFNLRWKFVQKILVEFLNVYIFSEKYCCRFANSFPGWESSLRFWRATREETSPHSSLYGLETCSTRVHSFSPV